MSTLCGIARQIGVCDVAPRDCKVRPAAVPTAGVYVPAAPHGAMCNADTGLYGTQQVRETEDCPQLGAQQGHVHAVTEICPRPDCLSV